MNGIIGGAFARIARFGVSKAAAFGYAVAVGVAGNLVFDSLRHDTAPAAREEAAQPQGAAASGGSGATAIIAPRPAGRPAAAVEPTIPPEAKRISSRSTERPATAGHQIHRAAR